MKYLDFFEEKLKILLKDAKEDLKRFDMFSIRNLYYKVGGFFLVNRFMKGLML